MHIGPKYNPNILNLSRINHNQTNLSIPYNFLLSPSNVVINILFTYSCKVKIKRKNLAKPLNIKPWAMFPYLTTCLLKNNKTTPKAKLDI